ncbi:bifunctional helix-turn-helix transcriptional regulator/GNAT family N-acetyltransferase [Kordiimonas sp.]|uniref:bifunctional helix-turn-helix transcriptional regulator/GNAT family N-acetyltransferase n=1 Tax=Kordiimonas sp. TaxID=1970157 RepID=UPI003A8D06BA
MHDIVPSDTVLAIRKFNRFYTKQFGFLQRRMLESTYSLVECRVIYELAQRGATTAKAVAAYLGLDAGYLSRIIKRFEDEGLVDKARSKADGRSRLLTLTAKGEETADELARMANDDIAARLETLDADTIQDIAKAMQKLEAVLGNKDEERKTAIIRSHRPGDIGWVVKAHGEIYSAEYNFNENFEALVARIAADFINTYDPKVEHCWIAEVNGENVGSIFLVKDTDEVAKLRLLLLTPKARGMGLGKKLVDECLAFARRAGYKRVELWTNAVLHTARHIYEKAGFELVSEDIHLDFGPPQAGQHWRLDF